jgi:hypothetical protein
MLARLYTNDDDEIPIDSESDRFDDPESYYVFALANLPEYKDR